MSLLPLSTARMACEPVGAAAVSLYAAVFFLVNATYIGLTRELMD
jgi:uncharacterized membrane protein